MLGDSKRVAADHYVYALTEMRSVAKLLAARRVACSTLAGVRMRERWGRLE